MFWQLEFISQIIPLNEEITLQLVFTRNIKRISENAILEFLRFAFLFSVELLLIRLSILRIEIADDLVLHYNARFGVHVPRLLIKLSKSFVTHTILDILCDWSLLFILYNNI